jgi:hypothetical protein
MRLFDLKMRRIESAPCISDSPDSGQDISDEFLINRWSRSGLWGIKASEYSVQCPT